MKVCKHKKTHSFGSGKRSEPPYNYHRYEVCDICKRVSRDFSDVWKDVGNTPKKYLKEGK